MSQGFLLGLPIVTSVLAFLVVGHVLGLARVTLAGAGARALELLGMSAIFLALNVALGLVVILSVRALTPVFLSVYVLNDSAIVALSLLQGLVFESWRSSHRRP